MDFAFTSEQDTLIRTLRAFAARELAPRSREWDKRGEFPWDIWRRMGELGLFGFRVPADYGGLESDYLTKGPAMGGIGRGGLSWPYGNPLAGLPGGIVGANPHPRV